MKQERANQLVVIGIAVMVLLSLYTAVRVTVAPEYQEMSLTGTGFIIEGDQTDMMVVDQTGTGDIVEFRDNGSVVWRLADGGAVTHTGDETRTGDYAVTGNTTLGDAITDNIYVYGQMRSYDGSDNWADISDVSALGRGNGWHAAYKVTGWGGATQFQALFANAQISATLASGASAYGAETKATVSNGENHLGTVYGLYGKLTAKDTGTQLAVGYPVYSIVDVNNSAVITTTANYMAELSGEATIGTVAVLKAKAADTWDYGIDFTGATMSTADIRLSNGETIDNSADGLVTINAQLGAKQYISDTTVSQTLTAAQSGAIIANDGAADNITHTLPAAALGICYGFLAHDNNLIYVDPDGSEQIFYSGSAAGDYMVNSAQYDYFEICATEDGWFPVSVIGTWADE